MAKSTPSHLVTTGRSLFAIAILGFGVQYAIYGHLRLGLPLLPHWLANGSIIAYVMAALLIAGGFALLAAWRAAATTLALALILLAGAFLHLQRIDGVLRNGNARTAFLEALALAATGLILHALVTGSRITLGFGRLFFAFTMIVFGAQHFMYTSYIASLIPAWIPQHHLWVLVTGVALIAAGISILTSIAEKYAAFGLFAMLLGWVAVLHAPRILHALHNGDEWSSGLVALGLCGGSLLLAASTGQVRRN